MQTTFVTSLVGTTFTSAREYGGESVTALTGFTAVLVGGSAGTDGSTDGAAEASSSRPRSDGAKLRDKPTTVRFRGPRATSDGAEHLGGRISGLPSLGGRAYVPLGASDDRSLSAGCKAAFSRGWSICIRARRRRTAVRGCDCPGRTDARRSRDSSPAVTRKAKPHARLPPATPRCSIRVKGRVAVVRCWTIDRLLAVQVAPRLTLQPLKPWRPLS
jgi:hypothetical protein